MKQTTLLLWSLALCILSTTPAFGKELTQANARTNTNKPSCCPVWNTPCDFNVSLTFLYWQPIQENMELGVLSDSSNSLDLVNGKEIDLNFEYKPGFKVGLGTDFKCSCWDSFLEYTWFQGTEKVRETLDPNNTVITLFPAWQIPDFLNPQYHSGSEKWSLKMHIIDWDLGRNFSLGGQDFYRTFFGLRGAFIKQNIAVDYSNTNASFLQLWPSTSIDQSSDSWGIGPRVGLNTNWTFCRNFKVFSKGEVDILFTQYNLKASQTSDVTVESNYFIKQDNANYLRAHIDLGLGIGWSYCLWNNRYPIDFSAGYNFQMFFDQNMFRSFINTQSIGKSYSPNGNLYLQGLDIVIRWDF